MRFGRDVKRFFLKSPTYKSLKKSFAGKSSRFQPVWFVPLAFLFATIWFALTSDSNALDEVNFVRNLVLKKVLVIQRHGDRTPVSAFTELGKCSGEDQAEREYWTNALPTIEEITKWDKIFPVVPSIPRFGEDLHPFSSLTSVGVQQLREVGAAKRKRYVETLEFLPTTLTSEYKDRIFFRSTNFARTIQSAQNFILGLYPSLEDRESPVPILTMEFKSETMLGSRECKKLGQKIKEVKALFLSRHNDTTSKFGKLLEEACEIEPDKKDAIKYFSHFFDIMLCRLEHSLPVPPSVNSDLLGELIHFNGIYRKMLYHHSKEITKLDIGRFIGEVISELQDDRYDFMLYVAHDTTLIPLLAAFGAFDGHWPPYASTLVFEVFTDKEGQRQYLQMYYNDKLMSIRVDEKRQEHLVRLEDFIRIGESYVPKDYEGECMID